MGDDSESDYFKLHFGAMELSFVDDFPNDYQVVGLSIFRSLDLQRINRSTYDVLNFLGDVGGLDGILVILGVLLT